MAKSYHFNPVLGSFPSLLSVNDIEGGRTSETMINDEELIEMRDAINAYLEKQKAYLE